MDEQVITDVFKQPQNDLDTRMMFIDEVSKINDGMSNNLTSIEDDKMEVVCKHPGFRSFCNFLTISLLTLIISIIIPIT